MYEYKYYKINLSFWSRNPEEDYHDVIDRESKHGWELIQIFAPPIQGYGVASYFELIFKRKKN